MGIPLEKAKSFLLGALVLLSVVLSVGLWNLTPVFEPLDRGGFVTNPAFGFRKSVDQVLLPVRIHVRLADKSYTMAGPFTNLYEKAWDELRKLAVRELGPVDNPQAIRREIGGDSFIEFQFGVSLNQEQVFQILKMLDPAPFQLKVTSITVHRDAAGNHYVVLSNFNQPVFRGKIGGQCRLFEQLEEWGALPKYAERNGSEGRFLIPVQKMKVPELVYEKLSLPVDSLTRTFFVDPGLTRRIRERNGSQILTDGNRTVQISTKKIRYSNSLPYDKDTATTNKDSSFQRAVDFINEHGGMQGSYVGRAENDWGKGRREYLFSEYRYGLPVLGEFTGIRISLNGNEVAEMARSAEYLGTEIKAETVEVAPPPPSVTEKATDVYLAYAPREGEGHVRLLPVWVVEYPQAPTVIYDAQTGDKWPDSGE